MRKFLPIFLLIVSCFFLFKATDVFADFERAYNDYLFQYDVYRKALTDYLTAKNKYLTYGTLVSQTEALSTAKTFLESRDQVITVYLLMLLERNPEESLQKIISDEITFYSDHKNLIPAVGSLDDSAGASKTFEDHFPQTSIVVKKTIANLLIGKLLDFDGRLASSSAGFEQEINSIKTKGKDVSTLERWLLETRNKRMLADEKITTAQALTNKLQPRQSAQESAKDYSNIQTNILEANQYLKEGTSYLKEIKEEIKYGNY